MRTIEDTIKDRDEAIREARFLVSHPYYIVDTETTGLKNAQMCQIGMLDSDGHVMSSYVKPTIPIEPGAMAVHHITDEMVKDAPTADQIITAFRSNKNMIIYNAPFDTQVIINSLNAAGAPKFEFPEIFDAMQIYSKFRGEWNDYYQNYRWHKLEAACNQCGIAIDVTLHDALADCIMTDKILHHMADQKLSEEMK